MIMGGWDFYCALCGGPLEKVYWDEREEEEDNIYDPAIISHEDEKMDWLANVRAIMSRPDEYGTHLQELVCPLDAPNLPGTDLPSAWISGPATHDMYGTLHITFPADDPPTADVDSTNVEPYVKPLAELRWDCVC